MPAHEHVSPIQFRYDSGEYGREHTINAVNAAGETMGEMAWHSKYITHLETFPRFQRQGVATAMWHEGQRMAAENAKIPKPKHSGDRTTSGDAWARSVGGKLPRRK